MLKAISVLLLIVLVAIMASTTSGRALKTERWVLLWEEHAQENWLLASGIGDLRIVPYSLPSPPFRLEVIARFSGDSDTSAYWLVRTRYLTLYVFGYGRYAVAGNPSLRSIWLHPAGDMNQMRLEIDSALNGTLQLNGQIVWQGVITPQMRSSGEWVIEAQCNCQSGSYAKLTWLSLAVYQH